MKKGLRNMIASAALATTSLFGGIKQANADQFDSEAVVPKAKIVEMAKTLRNSADLDAFKDKAERILETQLTLASDLEAFSQKNNIDLSKFKKMRIKTVNEDDPLSYVLFDNEDTYLLIGSDGKVMGKMSTRNKDPGTFFMEAYGTTETIDLKQKTFTIDWIEDNNGWSRLVSPEMKYHEDTERNLSELKSDIQDLLKAPRKRGKDLTPMTKEGEAIGPDDSDTVLLKGLGDHLTNWGKSNFAKRSKNLKKFLVKGNDGVERIDLSRCRNLIAACDIDGSLQFLALNYTEPNSTPEDGVLLQVGSDGSLHLTDADDGTMLLEVATNWVSINPAKGTFKVKNVHGDDVFSSEMSYAPEKTKAAPKTLAPAVRKAVAEKRVHN